MVVGAIGTDPAQRRQMVTEPQRRFAGTGVDSKRNKTIVVVEDDAGMRASLQFLLESCGYAVAAFATPEALFAELDGFDDLETRCAIMDIHLPGPDGFAVYKILSARVPGLPAIFITGQIDDRIRAEAKAVKAVAVLEKPFSDEGLLQAVGRALG
ncbi:MAG: response regulator transcription factor [Pseudomonadota bacterium]